jgi:nicotinate-nucleotide adenylyltransferase
MTRKDLSPTGLSRIGLFGGTFDPIHHGHLNAAWQSLQTLALDQVWFIPNHLPPHRALPQANALQRVAMIELAIADIAQFQMSRVEIDKNKPSFSIDTLITLKQKHPDHEFCWLMGNDSFNSLPTWHRWQEISEHAQLIVLTRPEHPLKISTELQQWLSTPGNKVKSVAITELNISSTDIKQQFQHQQLPRFLLPDAVLNYCQQHQLYHTSKN